MPPERDIARILNDYKKENPDSTEHFLTSAFARLFKPEWLRVYMPSGNAHYDKKYVGKIGYLFINFSAMDATRAPSAFAISRSSGKGFNSFVCPAKVEAP